MLSEYREGIMEVEMQYQYWLSNIEGIGSATIHKLLEQIENAQELYFLPEKQLALLSGLRKREIEKILESKAKWNLIEEWEKFLEMGISFVSKEMETFPEKLRYIDNPPYSIYYKGKLPNEKRKSVAIVGARRCSEYGRYMAEKIAERLSEYQVSVISGMAKGVDAYAHIGALRRKGETYAVLGSGVDVCYPAAHKQLYEEILGVGGVLSEYPPKTPPKACFFPARNRIISALCDVLVLIEAKEKSGSLITADFALEQGKDIFACPGRATDELSYGCNAYIRQGAGIVTSVDSFLTDIGVLQGEKYRQENLFEKFPNLLLEKEELLVYSCLDLRPKSLEEISYRTGLKTQYLISLLQNMLQKGVLRETFQNYYIRAE